jgi:hypothetical protein
VTAAAYPSVLPQVERGRTALDFFEAVEASRKASEAQRLAEDRRRDTIEKAAEAERVYRRELSELILTLVSEGTPATVARDIARGRADIAELAAKRDVAGGLARVAEQRAWRHTADRRDVNELIQWSRITAPLGQVEEPEAA